MMMSCVGLDACHSADPFGDTTHGTPGENEAQHHHPKQRLPRPLASEDQEGDRGERQADGCRDDHRPPALGLVPV